MTFTLRNDPPPRPKREVEPLTGTQRPLFAGLDCLPGQRDLFPTDGPKAKEQPRDPATA